MGRSVFIIGAGAAGGSLAVALGALGDGLRGVADLDSARADAVGRAASCPAFGEELPAAAREADVVIVAIPHSEIRGLASRAAASGSYGSHQVWLHLAGQSGAEALSPLAGRVRGLGAFHPALAFAPGHVTPIPCAARFAVNGDPEALLVARGLAASLGGAVVEVATSSRAAYHAACVLASNYLVALLAEARALLVAEGMPEADAEPLLAALAASSVRRAEASGVDAALTGPIRRGDAEAVASHLAALANAPEAHALYRTLGAAAIRLATRIGKTDGAALEEILRLLHGSFCEPPSLTDNRPRS